MMGLDGKAIEATNKRFKIDFCTVAHWKDGRIVEENLFYDLLGMMKQLGLM
jgi:ketosteroid isomerase-like protein